MSQSGLQSDAEQPLVPANDNAEKANESRVGVIIVPLTHSSQVLLTRG